MWHSHPEAWGEITHTQTNMLGKITTIEQTSSRVSISVVCGVETSQSDRAGLTSDWLVGWKKMINHLARPDSIPRLPTPPGARTV